MSRRFADRDTVREFVLEKTRPGFDSAFEVAQENLPQYFNDLGMLRTALQNLEGNLDPCSCGDPACLAAPQHREMYIERSTEAVEKLEAAIEEMIEAVTDMAWKTYVCDCDACKIEAMQASAPWN